MTTSNQNNADSDTLAYTPEEVQVEFFDHLVHMVPYWVNTTHYEYANRPLKDKLSGLMHSFYVTLAGNAGGFNTSVNMMVHSTQEEAEKNIAEGKNFFPIGWEAALDINDGALQYHSAEVDVELPVSGSDAPREWNEGEMRAIFHHNIARILNGWDDRDDVTDMEKAAGMMRDIFSLCEGNDPHFPAKVELVSYSPEEDKEYYIEEGENYYEEETKLSLPEKDLVAAWDKNWSRIQKFLKAGKHII